MATASPEAEKKRRKASLDTKREQGQPRVASRRYPLSQQAPVFETESLLNTSNVKSPSPIKNTTSPTSRTQPRQAFNSGRSLAPAYAVTPRRNNENKPPFSTSTSSRSSRRTPLKPKPSQDPRSTSRTTSSPQHSNGQARLKTPSPVRGRQNPVVSPSSSASSPPRGLAEAYQRIVDEENLAHEESIDEMAEYEDSLQSSGQSPEHHGADMEPTPGDESPTSLKAARRVSPHISPEEIRQLKPNFRDIYESLRDAENDTTASIPASTRSDSPIKADSQHAKDLRRMNGAVRSEPQIFRKALVGNRAGLTVENLKRNNDSTESLGSPLTASISSRGSDPSFNVPRQWGRKARPGKDWLSRINSKSGKLTGDVPKRRFLDEPSSALAGERGSDNKMAAAAAEIPLPAGDDVSSSSRSSTPTAAVLRAKSRDRVLEWESRDEDFTGRSLQVSDSPPIRIKNGTLDKILEQEISIVAKRAVTTSRLGELRVRGSMEHLGRRSLSRSREGLQELSGSVDSEVDRKSEDGILPQQSANRGTSTPSKAGSTEGLGHGEPVPDTPVVIYRSDSSSSRANDDSLESVETGRTSIQRPKHERQDSHALLRKLARATSSSPSPSRSIPERANNGDTSVEVKAEPRETAADAVNTDNDANSQRSNHDRDAETAIECLPPKPQPHQYTTPLQPKSTAYLKTPMVTGAWIDTPLPTGGRGPPMPTPDTDDSENKVLRSNSQKLTTSDLIRKLSPHTTPPRVVDEDLKKTAPRLPRSALESILDAAKSKAQARDSPPSPPGSQEDPTLLLGDSTIHSLEELITADTDVSGLLDLSAGYPEKASSSRFSDRRTPLESISQHQHHNDAPSISSLQPSRPSLTDLQSYSHQLSRLSALVPSLRETKKGLASLERTISAPTVSKGLTHQQQQPQPSSRSLSSEAKPCTEAGEFHDFIWPCERCGCPATLSRNPPQKSYDYDFDLARISIPIPRLWRWRHEDGWRPRVTWSGVVVLTLLLLYMGEMWARDRYCHKRFAVTMIGYGVDIHAPRPPFVLAKVAWRKAGVGMLFQVVRFWAGVVGWVIGFGGGGDGREPVSRDPRIGRPEWGPDLSMMGDEYL
ncbi:MAG: hypothetical protein Q9220_000207 [cf. Caloplaca sp. 1 TL-2023]